MAEPRRPSRQKRPALLSWHGVGQRIPSDLDIAEENEEEVASEELRRHVRRCDSHGPFPREVSCDSHGVLSEHNEHHGSWLRSFSGVTDIGGPEHPYSMPKTPPESRERSASPPKNAHHAWINWSHGNHDARCHSPPPAVGRGSEQPMTPPIIRHGGSLSSLSASSLASMQSWVPKVSPGVRFRHLRNSWKRRVSQDTTKLVHRDTCFDDVVQARRNESLKKWDNETRLVLMPGNRFLHMWRAWMVCIVLWTAFMSPFELAFSWWVPPIWYKVIFLLIDLSCWFDMFLNFFIASMKHGKIVISFRQRAIAYLRTWFIVDFLTNFPWDLLFTGAGKSRKLGKVMKLPKLFRMVRLLRAAKEEAYYFGVLFTLFVIILMAHYSSCCWVLLLITCKGSMFLSEEDSDLHPECPPIFAAYTQGLSVGMSTLSGSDAWLRFGQDESLGESTEQAAFSWGSSRVPEVAAALMCLMGFVALAVLFGRISQSISCSDHHTRTFHDRLANLHAADNQYGISHELYRRVRKHYHYVWSCGSNVARAVLQDDALSIDLRRQLALSFFGGALRKVPFLSFTEDTVLKQLCERVELECFAPEDFLVVAGEFGTDLFFIVVGQVRIQASPSNEVLRTLVEGSFFGEMALLLPESRRTVNAVADSAGWLLTVSRSDLEQICSEELLNSFRSVALERYQHLCSALTQGGKDPGKEPGKEPSKDHSKGSPSHAQVGQLAEMVHAAGSSTGGGGSSPRPSHTTAVLPPQPSSRHLLGPAPPHSNKNEEVVSYVRSLMAPVTEAVERRLSSVEHAVDNLAKALEKR